MIPVIAGTTTATIAGGGSVANNVPSPLNNTELLLTLIFTSNTTPSTTPGITPPAGWLSLPKFPVVDGSGTNRRGWFAYWKIANNEPASYTWTATDPGGQNFLIWTFRIQFAPTLPVPIDDGNAQINAASLTCTAPSINGNVNDLIIDFFASTVGNTQTYTVPGTDSHVSGPLSVGSLSGDVDSNSIGSSGPTGTISSTLGTSAINYGGRITIPAGVPTPSLYGVQNDVRFETVGGQLLAT